MKRQAAFILAGLLLAACLAGCNRSFTRERYETIYIGQPDWDVREVLGRPTLQQADAWTYVHSKTPYYQAVIYFRDGKVVGKDWSYEPPQQTGTRE